MEKQVDNARRDETVRKNQNQVPEIKKKYIMVEMKDTFEGLIVASTGSCTVETGQLELHKLRSKVKKGLKKL